MTSKQRHLTRQPAVTPTGHQVAVAAYDGFLDSFWFQASFSVPPLHAGEQPVEANRKSTRGPITTSCAFSQLPHTANQRCCCATVGSTSDSLADGFCSMDRVLAGSPSSRASLISPMAAMPGGGREDHGGFREEGAGLSKGSIDPKN
ncbi:hypothetical protein EYF80_042313 [Liparis tanakae]|uniref:Uncharacterized protein n=1 Tax=Liparis tanakae TaxID=230148 RepID=A0A4Z2G2J6_9TELE|nr:hypothetical protein EYF80_042313 [Liparis tanakae]